MGCEAFDGFGLDGEGAGSLPLAIKLRGFGLGLVAGHIEGTHGTAADGGDREIGGDAGEGFHRVRGPN